MLGGEIFVPKIPSFKVIDLAEIIAPDVPKRIVGIRPGEKIHEVMITEDDAPYTVETNFGYAILTTELLEHMHYSRSAKKVPESFRYSSDNNPSWFTPDSFRKLLVENDILN
jgi:UDP-N-acetylglucosamine 4,6-dehydratase